MVQGQKMLCDTKRELRCLYVAMYVYIVVWPFTIVLLEKKSLK